MKWAFSSNAFRKYSLEETAHILADIGYQGMELMCDRPHAWPPDLDDGKIDSIRDAIRDSGLEVSNLNAFMMCAEPDGSFHYPSWIEQDERRRQRRRQHTLDCLRIARRVGGPRISTEPGGPLEGRPYDQMMKEFRRELEPAARAAEAAGVQLNVEPEPGLLIENADQFDEFIAGVDSPAVGLNFDMGHFYCVGQDPAALIRRFGKRARHFHLEDIAADRRHFHLPPGQGAMDYDSIFAALGDIGYDGWVTVELYPFLEDAPKVAAEAFRFLGQYR
jgi:sugar phosphate isomerase/epimerase